MLFDLKETKFSRFQSCKKHTKKVGREMRNLHIVYVNNFHIIEVSMVPAIKEVR